MYAYVYVCVCVCMYISVCMRTFMYVYAYALAYAYAYVYVHVYVHMCIFSHTSFDRLVVTGMSTLRSSPLQHVGREADQLERPQLLHQDAVALAPVMP